MTPDKRLDQIEPVMADVLQKVDRLIEGQGKLVEVATRADQNANTAARGVANLTVTTQKQFEELKASQELLKAGQELLQVGQEQLKTSQDQLQTGQELLMAKHNQLQTGQELLMAKHNQLQAGQELLMAKHNQLQAGQELILQILREKLP